jgi:Flp pilus assembly protein TadG
VTRPCTSPAAWRRRGRSWRSSDRGQAAVELALALPLVFLVLLGAVQVALVARDQVGVVHAAREGARAAAVAADPVAEATAAARQATTLDPSRLTVEVIEQPSQVRVTVRYAAPTDVPLVGGLIGDVTVTASAVMRVEP